MKSYSILVIIVTLFLPSGAQLSKKIDESLAIQCPCENTSICNWYHNNQSVPIHWIQGNGSLLLPANDWSVYGVIIGQCASVNYTNLITNPGMCIVTYVVLVLHTYVSIYLCINSSYQNLQR